MNRRAWISIAIYLGLGIGALALPYIGTSSKPPTSQAANPKPDKDDGTYENDDKGSAPGIAITRDIVEAIRAIAQQQQTARTEDEANNKRWWPISPFWAIVYVTIVYAVIAFCQWDAIRRQAKRTDETFRLSQRAEVTLGRPDGLKMRIVPPKVGERLVIQMFFYNSGKTGAQEFFARAVVSHMTGGRISERQYFAPEPWRMRRRWNGGQSINGPQTATIGAGAIHMFPAFGHLPLTGEQVREIEIQQNQFISVTGKFQYIDGFGQTEFRTFSAQYSLLVGDFLSNVAFDGGYGIHPPYEVDEQEPQNQ